MARRFWAAEYAKQYAKMEWADWEKTGFATYSSGDQNCYDCTRFVSYVLWRVGFRMRGGTYFSDKAHGGAWVWSKDNHAGWWANYRPTFNRDESSAWSNVASFRDWWKANGAVEIGEERFVELQKGDVIIWNYWNVGVQNPWDHAAMVIEPMKTMPFTNYHLEPPHVASRGNGECYPDENFKDIVYNSKDLIPYDIVVLNGERQVKGLKMPY